MKTRLNITVNQDLAQEAKEKNINISELTQIAILKELDKKTKPKDQIDNIAEIKCSWCREYIHENEHDKIIFYVCQLHNNVFCENCAKNYGKTEIDFREAPKCRNRRTLKEECIYLKKELEFKEIND